MADEFSGEYPSYNQRVLLFLLGTIFMLLPLGFTMSFATSTNRDMDQTELDELKREIFSVPDSKIVSTNIPLVCVELIPN